MEAILRPFRFTLLLADTQMSRAEAMQIAEDSKADWWAKNERRFAPPEAQRMRVVVDTNVAFGALAAGRGKPRSPISPFYCVNI